MVVLKNPTDSEVSITVKGVTKSVPAQSTIQLEDEFAAAWKLTHGFLEVVDEAVSAPVVDKAETVAQEVAVEAKVEEKKIVKPVFKAKGK